MNVSGTRYFYMNDLNGIDLSNVKLAILMTCNTGNDFEQNHIINNTPENIVEKMVICGAETVVGFSSETTVRDCNKFAKKLSENLVIYEMTITDAIASINYVFTIIIWMILLC